MSRVPVLLSEGRSYNRTSRQRHERRDDRNIARTRLHFVDLAAAAVEVAVDRSHVFFRSYDLDLHDRFEEDRFRLFHCILERQASRDVE